MSNPIRALAIALLDSQQAQARSSREQRTRKLELSRTELELGHLNQSLARELEQDQATVEAYAPAIGFFAGTCTKGELKSSLGLVEKGVVEPAIAHAGEQAATDIEAAQERAKSARKTAGLLEREASGDREHVRKDAALIERIGQLASE